jgi:hydroxyacylglutathione hydrolase
MIHAIMSASFDSNCYIIRDKKAALIDSGIDPSRILKRIGELGTGIDFLINTHCHYDHIDGDLRIKEKTNALICIHELDAGLMEKGDMEGTLAALFGGKIPKIDIDIKLVDGQIIDLGEIKLEVVHTPGHTPGSICLYEPKSRSLFSGDTVFSDGVGRTDLEGGDWETLQRSIEKLLDLYRDSGIDKIYPGHGPVGSGADIERIYRAYF